MKINSKSLPALALAFLFLLALSAMAQKPDVPSAAKSDIITPTNPLALTPAERTDLDTLAARFNQANAELQARLQVLLDIGCLDCNEAYAVKLATDDVRKYYQTIAKPAQAAYLKRLEEIQQAHDCLGCALGKDGAFVKPEKK